MIVTPIKTQKVVVGVKLNDVLDASLSRVEENDILVVTSKIISICEGTVIPIEKTTKNELVPTEADYYIPSQLNPYGFHITIKNNTLIASAGIDESNGNGYFILWPKDPQASANQIRAYLQARFHVKHIGVIVTDSHVLPLRWGTVGTAISHSGFAALNSYIGKPDIFDRNLKLTNANVAEGLAAAAVVCMGEGNEQTPLALIRDASFVQFQDREPSEEELKKLAISKDEDIFAPLLNAVKWEKEKR
ncbi:putative folate metabolism gamma-glutamate ligase [Candidatus Cerribacteria bacterium 'Amazon FNV 2010 28 9']|uniref:Putative folate metabolism gamma-glutamate ligase n=1 Tax=Candidatus Cerribacteria bacterium 'Amazon FNV 2010 28 9' TaxID=2081795 RepID=A0A317JUS3_9BACT|nr:MAG: putative folate metabolism gamma-glutamate ligase [Candidatus Cerribacteria bacterium 'Amazon FNV 2010 28 9']